MRQGDGGDAGIDLDFGLGVGIHLQRMAVQRVPDVSGCRIDDVGRRHPLALDVNRRRVDARHVEDVLEETIQPVQLHDGGACLSGVFAGRQMTAQVLDRDANRRERRLQVVAERREQRRREIRLLPHQFRGFAFAEELRPLDRNRDHTRNGVKCADVEGWRDGGEQADRLRAVPERDDQHAVALVIIDPHVTTIRAPVSVELEGPARLCEGLIQEIRLNPHFIMPP